MNTFNQIFSFMITKTINQTVSFSAMPIDVYNLFMNEKKHTAISGSAVTMSSKINGKFEVFDGYCHGFNIELVEGKKIVQAWHFAEDGWPDEHYSICTFLFDELNGKTKLQFTQTNIPAHKVDDLKKGWKQYYWNPMKEFLKGLNR